MNTAFLINMLIAFSGIIKIADELVPYEQSDKLQAKITKQYPSIELSQFDILEFEHKNMGTHTLYVVRVDIGNNSTIDVWFIQCKSKLNILYLENVQKEWALPTLDIDPADPDTIQSETLDQVLLVMPQLMEAVEEESEESSEFDLIECIYSNEYKCKVGIDGYNFLGVSFNIKGNKVEVINVTKIEAEEDLHTLG